MTAEDFNNKTDRKKKNVSIYIYGEKAEPLLHINWSNKVDIFHKWKYVTFL